MLLRLKFYLPGYNPLGWGGNFTQIKCQIKYG